MLKSVWTGRGAAATCFLLMVAGGLDAAPSALFARGYAVIPVPQRVSLAERDVEFGPSWRVEYIGPVDRRTQLVLSEELVGRHKATPATAGGATKIRLELRANAVAPGAALDSDSKAIAMQAYRLVIKPGLITVTANAATGLFYGIETLTQLLKSSSGKLWLPECEITDWPDLQIRNIYWDDAHHLDRPEALKRAIRQAAYFKINGFVLKLEGHFQFRHAPAIVEPYALTPAQFQELTNYALSYHVQLIPYLDGPGHIAFILKHPEYAKLRSYPESNYEICATNPASYTLFQEMFQDLLDANRGVDYVYLSTDEAYYVGWASNSQCDEKSVADRYGSRGKLLAEFITKVSGYLHGRGRKVVFWGEYPLVPEDIPSLPPYMINGEVYTPVFDKVFRKHGIRQMIYTATQGEERIFPEYFPLNPARRLHTGRETSGRSQEVFDKISFEQSRGVAAIQGAVVAGWADAGQHPEDFWLGYIAGTAASWHPASADSREIVASFMQLFYGRSATGMERAYQLLSYQAQYWMDSWEPVESTSRKPIWGSSARIFTPPHAAKDQSLPLPPVPGEEFKRESTWAAANSDRLRLAAEFLTENDELLGILQANLLRAEQNRYNIEVLLSNALLCRQNLELILSLGRIDKQLTQASAHAAAGRSKEAVAAADNALDALAKIRDQRNQTLAGVTETWYKSWFPRIAEANGRRFLHEVDDVKDHLPDRTVDMSYLILRQLQLPATRWAAELESARNRYAGSNKLPPRNSPLDWTDTNTIHRVVNNAPTLE